jgi:hypothetical protein
VPLARELLQVLQEPPPREQEPLLEQQEQQEPLQEPLRVLVLLQVQWWSPIRRLQGWWLRLHPGWLPIRHLQGWWSRQCQLGQQHPLEPRLQAVIYIRR